MILPKKLEALPYDRSVILATHDDSISALINRKYGLAMSDETQQLENPSNVEFATAQTSEK
jgi:hypothetical protein